jgi:hypothetical protein
MNFGLKTYLTEETKRFNVVQVKKKLFLNPLPKDKYEWSTSTRAFVTPEVTLWPGWVMLGFNVEHGTFRWQTVVDEHGSIRFKNGATDGIEFKPSEYDELMKLKALKGLA